MPEVLKKGVYEALVASSKKQLKIIIQLNK
jgi:hypothetical protein